MNRPSPSYARQGRGTVGIPHKGSHEKCESSQGCRLAAVHFRASSNPLREGQDAQADGEDAYNGVIKQAQQVFGKARV